MRRSVALALLCIAALFAVPALAQGDTGEIIEPQQEPPTAANGWQAASCTTDEPVVGEPKIKCSPQTPGVLLRQAGGHPAVGFTQYIIQHNPLVPGLLEPIKEPLEGHTIKTLRVDLPPGETVNPNATPTKCSLAEFLNEPAPKTFVPTCAPTTVVGQEQATLVTNAPNVEVPGIGILPNEGSVIPPTEGLTKVPVYNLQPKPGEPALFGFVIAAQEVVFLETEVAWEGDFHESFTIHLPNTAAAPGLNTLISRLINNGKAGDGTFISKPSTCFNPAEAANKHLYSTWFRAESYEKPDANFPKGSTPAENKIIDASGQFFGQEGCDKVPFTPGLDVSAGTGSVDSPSTASVETTLKWLTGAESEVQESHLRKAVVTLPESMGLNPSGSVGLGECTDAQFKKGTRTFNNECPANSKIGSVTIESPPLNAPLTGSIFVGTQKSSNPESGEEFRILVEAKEPKEGIDVRLVGNTAANKTTGQLTTTFNEKEVGELAGALPEGLPQVPFTSVKLKFDGPKLVLTSPSTCATEAKGQMEPWARPGENVAVSSSIKLTSDPGGGSCPTSLGARKFTPSYTAASDSTKAAQYSPFKVHIGRSDGQQEIKAVNVTLPKGLTAKLAGIPYCGEAEIAAAAASSGRAQQSKPSCSSNSAIGRVNTVSGSGNAPLSLPGTAYLAGPYKGAPISMVTVTPAVSGPFDLGTVVVRVALNVNPLTAQVNAVSDPIPNVFGGVKLDIRSIDVNMDRFKFMLNPTNCAAGATAGTLNGGGSNPANPANWSSFAISAPYQATGCKALGFKPTFHARISGPTTRAKNPQIRAIVKARPGDANIARTALNLPHSLFLDQGHIKTVCTRVQLAAQECPQNSIYGHAEASSPLLKQKLKGPVYLVSSKHKLPDLLADLKGQITIQLDGVISSKHGGLKTVFNNTPDVPLKTFILNMRGGKKSLLQNSTNLCKSPQLAVLNMKGQNGKTVKNNKFRLNISSCGSKKKK
ncbi:MAG TPA: hypothetical protein VGI17_08425 [Solirubrobacterales bacterium]